MEQKVLNVKTILCFLILIIFASKLSAQINNEGFDEAFIKSFSKNFRMPKNLRDTCIGSVVLLSVEIDKNCKVVNFSFSDNASEFLKNELTNTVGKLDLNLISNYLFANKLKNIYLIYPVLFLARKGDCSGTKKVEEPGQVLSVFNGSLLKNPCMLRETITFMSYGTVE